MGKDGPSRDRTCHRSVMSRALYQLSYGPLWDRFSHLRRGYNTTPAR